MKTIRAVLFTIIIPGSVAVIFPSWLLVKNRSPDFDAAWLRWLAWVPGVVGLVFLLTSILEFLIKGGGSPAIWFTHKLGWLIGKEPDRLVESRFYRISRNPMYLGVILLLVGESLWFGSYRLLGYAFSMIIIFHLVVRYLEEPHLRKKYGQPYEDFCRRVPRWF